MNPTHRAMRSLAELWWFAALACGITWAIQVPPLLARRGGGDFDFAPWIYGVALWGPAIAAVLVTIVFEGADGVRRLVATLQVRGPIRWYVFALVAPLGALGLVMAGVALAGRMFPTSQTWLTALRQILWFTPLFLREELGWRGFFLPVLLRSRSPIAATAWTTFLWAVWHVPLYLAATTPVYALIAFVMIVPVSAWFTLLFLKTRSIVPCLLFHSSIDFGLAILLFGPLKQDYVPAFAAWAGVLCVAGIPAIVALARFGRPSHVDIVERDAEF